MLIKLKSCPRCNGALFVDWDQHGRYVECLQCGYLRDFPSQPRVERQSAEKRRSQPWPIIRVMKHEVEVDSFQQ